MPPPWLQSRRLPAGLLPVDHPPAPGTPTHGRLVLHPPSVASPQRQRPVRASLQSVPHRLTKPWLNHQETPRESPSNPEDAPRTIPSPSAPHIPAPPWFAWAVVSQAKERKSRCPNDAYSKASKKRSRLDQVLVA